MSHTALVTGARGFVGRHISHCLSNSGWQVIGLGHGCWNSDQAAQWGISQWFEGSVDLETLLAKNIQASLIVHCAGTSTVGRAYAAPLTAFRNTVSSTVDILEYARRANSGSRVVYISSAAVYGVQTSSPIPENCLLLPISPYGHFKAAAEQMCQTYAQAFGVEIVIVRPFSVYGPGQRKQFLSDACRKVAAGEPYFSGSGREMRDWIHVSDVARLITAIAGAGPNIRSCLNAATGIGTDIHTIAALICCEMESAAQPVFLGRTNPGDPHDLIGTTAAASALGWHPKISVEAGVRDYVHWYLSENPKDLR